MKRIVKRHFECIPSTNSWAKAHTSEFETGAFHIITAKEQSGGRGRDGRTFISPVGGLYLTCAFEMPLPNFQSAPLSIALGAMIAKALHTEFKWPNDLVFEQKKVGGLLIEAASGWWIVGVGVNVSTSLELLASVKEIEPTSLNAIGNSMDVSEAAETVAKVIYETSSQFLKEGLLPFLPTIRKKVCYKKGEEFWVRVGRGEKVKAQYEGIDDEGRLLVFMKECGGNSQLRALSQAEVFFQ